jgi:hypothetical protein
VIPDIGILVAAYVFTRMLSLIGRPIDPQGGWQANMPRATRIFAIVTVLVAVVIGFDLLLRGTTGVSLPELR